MSLRYLGFQLQRGADECHDGRRVPRPGPFDWGRRGDNLAEKARTVVQARNGAAETEAQIAVEVGHEMRKWQEASLLLKATRTGQAAAVEQLRVTTNRYAEEAVLIRDLLQGQSRAATRGSSISRRCRPTGLRSPNCGAP